MQKEVHSSNTARKIIRRVLRVVLFAVLLLVLLCLSVLLPPVQDFIKQQAVHYLQGKIGTKVAVDKIYIGLPKTVNINGIYIEDQTGDTLLHAGSIHVDIGIWKLITGRAIVVSSIDLNDITAKVNRLLPDTTFNFQYIADAFASDSPKTTSEESSGSLPIEIGKLQWKNIRAIYKDDVTGYDVSLHWGSFAAQISEFNPGEMKFGVESLALGQVHAVVHQQPPLVVAADVPPSATDTTAAAALPVLQLGNIQLQDVDITYNSIPAALYGMVQLGNLSITPRELDLQRKRIAIEALHLDNTTAIVRMGKSGGEEEQPPASEIEKPADSEEDTWQVRLGAVEFNNNRFQFDDSNAPVQPKGMDYMHLKLDDLTLHANNLIYNSDSIAGTVTKGSLKEQSGFELTDLQADFLYASTQAYLKNLLLKTPLTEIKRSVSIQYPSIAALQKDIGQLRFDLQLDDSRLHLKDVLTFVPTLDLEQGFADAGDVLRINSHIKGGINDLHIAACRIAGLGHTVVDISGHLRNAADMNRMGGDLHIRRLTTSRSDLHKLLPPGTLPDNITLPEQLQLAGRLQGAGGKLYTALELQTSLGSAGLTGHLQDIADPEKAVYDLNVQTHELDIGTLLQQKENLGPVSLTVTAKGQGYDLQHADAVFSGKLIAAVVNNYRYEDLRLDGSIARQQATINAAIADPNIHVTLAAAADLSQTYPALQLKAGIDSIKTRPLHLTNDALIYRGNLDLDFSSTHPDSLQGKLFILQSLLVHNQHRVQLDSVKMEAGYKDSLQFIALESDVFNALLQGKYRLTEMGDILPRLIQPYFSMDTAGRKTPGDFNFTLQAGIHQSPVLNALVPALTRLDSVRLDSRFTSDNGWYLNLHAPAIVYGATNLSNLLVSAQTQDTALVFNTAVQRLQSGDMVQLFNSQIKGTVADNKADVVIHLRDREETEKYHLNLLLAQTENGIYDISLSPDSLLLNYQSWNAPDDNKITIAHGDIHARNVAIEKEGQAIKIQSVSDELNAPLQLQFQDFKLSTITGFVQSDSLGVNGSLNGEVAFRDITSQPVFVGDLRIDDLSMKQDTVGNLLVKVDNTLGNTYRADIALNGKGNDLKVSGTYETGSSRFDMNLDIATLPLSTVQTLSGGMLSNASGAVNGQFAVAGTAKQPQVNGYLNFDKAIVNVSMLNSNFNIDQQQLTVNEEGIRFNRFGVKDDTGNELTLDGLAATTGFTNYNLDLTLRADNFSALNSTRKDNDVFYGKLVFDANLRIKGTDTAPEIDGRLRINDKTAMTVVLPQEEPGVVEREGVVVFVDKSAGKNDSLFLVRYDSLNTTAVRGMKVSVNAEVDKEADFTVIVDQGSGDQLKVKGGAQLNVDVAPGGEITMSGVYEIDKGSYDFSFNMLKRSFQIDKGSKITWGGEPTDATVDITAIYTATTAPLDLVKNQLGAEVQSAERNKYLQRLPFNVLLKMEGELMRPRISFDIVLPEDKTTGISSDIVSNVKTKLDMMRQDEAEMNKQVFALLLLNRFVAEDPFTASGGASAATMVRQSVNKIMADQLNRWAADIIKGIDINFDLESTEDFTTGERQERTDLNVGLSKRMFNDRLTVTVGSNFELDGPQAAQNRGSNIAGNVNIQYRLTEDGRYMLRGYRNNDYQGIIEGYVIETGVGFTITMDYNRFREIFRKRRTPEDRKKQREQQREERRKQAGSIKQQGGTLNEE